MEFLSFHLRESACPYCAASLEEMQAEAGQGRPAFTDLRDRLMRSTRAAIRRAAR
jgi:hypothetical protein